MSLKPKVFVISALQHDPSNPGSDLKTVYLGVDKNSGGYPFWSSSFRSAEIFTTRLVPEEYFFGCDYIYHNIATIQIFEVILEPV